MEKEIKLYCVDCGEDISDCYDELLLLGIIDEKTDINEVNKIIRCSECHFKDAI